MSSYVLCDAGRSYSRRVQPTTAAYLASGDIDAVLAFHHATFGDARMDGEGAGGEGGAGGGQGSEGGSGSGGNGAGGGTGTGAGAPAAGVPQDQVNAIVARETEKAKAAALQSLADEWGVPLDEAKQIIQRTKDADAAKMTEAEKREKAAADKEAAATARETAATAKERDATVRAALAVAGCTGKDDMADAARLVQLPDGDLDEKAAEEAVDALKKRRPELFGAKRTQTTPPAFTPPGSPAPSGSPTSMEQARERYRNQQSGASKSA